MEKAEKATPKVTNPNSVNNYLFPDLIRLGLAQFPLTASVDLGAQSKDGRNGVCQATIVHSGMIKVLAPWLHTPDRASEEKRTES